MVLLFAPALLAQADEYEVQTLNVDQGLSQSTVFSLLQDERGRIWIATADGLDIYDGYEISVLRNTNPDYAPYLHSTITGLAQDNFGNVFIGTASGLTVFNIRTHTLTSLIFPESGTKLHQGSIDYLLIDKNNTLWACGNDHVYTLDLQGYYTAGHNRLSVCEALPAGSYLKAAQFNDGTIYICGSKPYFLDPQTKKQKEYLQHPLLNRYLQRPCMVLEYQPGKFFIPITNKKAFLFQMSSGPISEITNPGNVSEISEICEAVPYSDSLIIVGAKRAGILLFNTNSHTYSEATFNKELESPPVTQIIVDRAKNIWIGTAGGGGLKKVRFINRKFERILNRQIDPKISDGQFVKAIWPVNPRELLLGYFNKGLVLYNRVSKQSTTFQFAKKAGKQQPFSDVFAIMQVSEDSFLIGTSIGTLLFNYNTKQLQHIPTQLPDFDYNIWCFHKNKQTIFAGTGFGLYSVTDSLRQVYAFDRSNSRTHTNSIPVVFQYSEDELLLGTHWRGIIRFNLKSRSTDDSLWRELVKAFPAVSYYIKTIHRDAAGNLWIGAQNVLFKKKPDGTIQYFSETNGLANSFIYGVLEDKSGNIWVSTNKGLSRIAPNNQVRNYRMEDGLQSLEFNTGAFILAPWGEMFFGGIGGINCFYPESVRDNPETPKVSVTGIMLNNRQLDEKLIAKIITDHTAFAYDENSLSFSVSGMVFNNKQTTQYSFFLRGFDKLWTKPGTARDIRFTNLDAGDYVLLVKACNEDGVWSPEQVLVQFTIRPPFWETVWFISIMLACSIAGIILIIRTIIVRKYKRSLQKIREEQLVMRERERIARDLHDELGATLTSVSMRVQILQQTKGNAQTEEALNNSIGNAIRKLDEIVWTVNPSNDDMQNLFGYITEFAQEFFENSAISYRFDFPDDLPAVKLSSERRYNVFLIVKEALNNVQKYSGASQVFIKAEKIDSRLTISVTDDGKGFDVNAIATTSNGLRNMHRRAEMADAEVRISSEPGKGCKVEIGMDLAPVTDKD